LRTRLQELLGEDVRLALRLDPALWRASVTAAEVEGIVVNLVSSASSLLFGRGSLEIETSNHRAGGEDLSGCAAGPYVRLSVSHSGYMTERVARSLSEEALTTGRQGPQSGLATVCGIVQARDGYVRFISRRGLGSSADIYLPAADGTPQAGSRAEDSRRRGGRIATQTATRR
jgi:hypothetical protein